MWYHTGMTEIVPTWEMTRSYDVRTNEYVVTLTVFTVERDTECHTLVRGRTPIMTETRRTPAEDIDKFLKAVDGLNAVKEDKLRKLLIMFHEIPC